uniref:Uncharacterized protein n=1 Tax=Nelumbo nucifera TaxID=4432 RepID=A0A822YT01_NELNU|nr:TPA_asm: hypothetical protein HUJ06_004855 [Nelumbo nucifera]
MYPLDKQYILCSLDTTERGQIA